MDTRSHDLKRHPHQLKADAETELLSTPPVEAPARSTDVLLHELQVHQIELEMQNETDILVSDYRLREGETGFDVITAVRAKMGAELPAILITGDTDPKLLRSMTEHGIVVLHKPLDLETLQAYLEDLTASTK